MVVGIAGVALTGCVLMVIILKYGRSSKFGIKGESPHPFFICKPRNADRDEDVVVVQSGLKGKFRHFFKQIFNN